MRIFGRLIRRTRVEPEQSEGSTECLKSSIIAWKPSNHSLTYLDASSYHA